VCAWVGHQSRGHSLLLTANIMLAIKQCKRAAQKQKEHGMAATESTSQLTGLARMHIQHAPSTIY